MAKISARGHVKLASASRVRPIHSSFGPSYSARDRIALRSDGAVLRATDVNHPNGRPSRGGYSVAGKVKDRTSHETMIAAFERYARANGYTMGG